jgi:HD superfamily phosphodiesterase
VQFGAPAASDLERFFDAMEQHAGERIWVHCAANMRVSAFLGLYRALRQDWPVAQAFALMHDIWQPDRVWSEFIASQLAKVHGD